MCYAGESKKCAVLEVKRRTLEVVWLHGANGGEQDDPGGHVELPIHAGLISR